MSLVLLGILNSQAAAAGAGGAVQLVEKVTLASNTTTVTFTGLSSLDYGSYQILANARVTADEETGGSLVMRLNNDTGSHYGYDRWWRNGNSSIRGSIYTNQTSFSLLEGIRGLRTGNSLIKIDLFNVKNSSAAINWLYEGNNVGDGTDEDNVLSDGGGIYRPSTEADLNEIDFTAASQFAAGSEFWLYGYEVA